MNDCEDGYEIGISCTGCGLCVERCITEEPAIRIIQDGWQLKESESEDWVPSARENLSRS